MLPGRDFLWDFDRCGLWGFRVKCFSRYWELTFMKGDGLVGEGRRLKVSTRGKKAECSSRLCLVPWESGEATTSSLLQS